VTLAANSTVLAGGGNVLRIGPGSGTAINLQGNTLDYTGAGGHEVLGGIFGTGGIAKRGSGTLTISGSGTYSGTTSITDGKIIANATSALGTSPVTVALGKSLELQGGFDVGGGQLTLNGESLTNVSGNNTYSGPVTAAVASRIFVTSGTMTLSNAITASSSAITFSGNGVTLISGTLGAGLTTLDINAKASDVPTVIMTGNSPNFTGNVAVQTGTFQLGNGGTTGSLTGTTAINIGGASGRFIVNQSDTVTQGADFGALTGVGGFIQAGSGTTVLAATASYSGTTAVTAGALLVNGRLDNSNVIVSSGALLGGSGQIVNMVQILSGGTISPGNSPGIITTGTLILNNGSTTKMEITGTTPGVGGYDQIIVTGSLQYGGTLQLQMSGTYADNTVFDLFSFGANSVSGSFAAINMTGSIDGWGSLAWYQPGQGRDPALGTFAYGEGVWQSDWTTVGGQSKKLLFNQVTGDLTVVPEPSTIAMAGAGVVALAVMRWRRRRRTAAAREDAAVSSAA
jgi:autotransporter-associated beta strand protein